ncbi:MAG: alpha/beta hydrolase [Sphingobium sp.]|nr:MAG: alpha/beta hydrolase [Sphingobium sp.]
MDDQAGAKPASGLLDRRLFLTGATGLVALGASQSASGQSAPKQAASGPMPPRTIPAAWTGAPVIELWPDGTPGGGFRQTPLPIANPPPVFMHNVERPCLRVFRPARPNGRALLVIPGGAYIFVSIDNEGVDVARAMTERGYTVFVLVYRLPGEGWGDRADVPLQDAQRAMRVVRSLAGTHGFDPRHVYALGFSAGGHLAASLATDFGQSVYRPRDAVDALDARPFATGLGYPVISMTPPVTHAQSRAALLGPEPDAALVARRSPAAHVTAETPPVFLMHALDDPAVPPENSLEMMQALRAARRPVESHFFQEGGHGFGLGRPQLPASQWIGLFATWLDRQIAPAA